MIAQQILFLPTSMEGAFSSSPHQPEAWSCHFIVPMEVNRGGWAEALMHFCGWLATVLWGAAAVSGLVSKQKTQRADLNPSSGHLCGLIGEWGMTIVLRALRFKGCLLVQCNLINMSSQIFVLFYKLCQCPTLNLPCIRGQLFGCVIYAVTNGLLV